MNRRLRNAAVVLKVLVALVFIMGGAEAANWTVNPGDSVQAAINNASLGDTILVNSGTYNENVIVNKTLTLQGVDNGTGLPVVDAGGSRNVITISADECTLEGFVAKNSGGDSVGIKVTSKRNNITKNTATSNEYGIRLYSSSNNIISGNNATGNTEDGIYLEPLETAVIDYMAEALWSGRFENSVEVDARSVDGSVVRPIGASNVVEVGEVEESEADSCTGWEPPEWGFVSVCDEGCELEG